jgi:hypothetical protein
MSALEAGSIPYKKSSMASIPTFTRQVCCPPSGGNRAMSDSFKTFGSQELCTWCCGVGISRFQTNSPRFARKLSQRSNAKLVAWSVNKEYLRVFQEPIEPWRARRLVRRYLKATNEAFLDGVSHQRAPKVPTRVVSAGRTERVDFRRIPRKNPLTAIPINFTNAKRRKTLRRKAVHRPTESMLSANSFSFSKGRVAPGQSSTVAKPA